MTRILESALWSIKTHPFTFLSIWIALALVGVIGNGPEIAI